MTTRVRNNCNMVYNNLMTLQILELFLIKKKKLKFLLCLARKWQWSYNIVNYLVVQFHVRYGRNKSHYLRQLEENPGVQRSNQRYSEFNHFS